MFSSSPEILSGIITAYLENLFLNNLKNKQETIRVFMQSSLQSNILQEEESTGVSSPQGLLCPPLPCSALCRAYSALPCPALFTGPALPSPALLCPPLPCRHSPRTMGTQALSSGPDKRCSGHAPPQKRGHGLACLQRALSKLPGPRDAGESGGCCRADFTFP